MSRVVFWNTQRLGRDTDEARREAIGAVLADLQGDFTLVCELTTACAFPPAQNLNYREENAAQLCYGAWTREGYEVELTRMTPYVTTEYREAALKGGGRFENLASRALAYVGLARDVHVFVFHAPASGNARKAVCHAACWLDEEYGRSGQKWLLVGDFNITPEELAATQVGIDLDDFIHPTGIDTHVARNGTWRQLDYALSNVDLEIEPVAYHLWQGLSDHAPIVIEFGS